MCLTICMRYKMVKTCSTETSEMSKSFMFKLKVYGSNKAITWNWKWHFLYYTYLSCINAICYYMLVASNEQQFHSKTNKEVIQNCFITTDTVHVTQVNKGNKVS